MKGSVTHLLRKYDKMIRRISLKIINMKNGMELFSLKGKTAIVTGGSRGLGLAMALGLASAGADVAVADVLPTDEAVRQVKALGRESIGIKVDVTNAKDITAMVEKTVKEFGRVDILMNNAGIFLNTPFVDGDEKTWDKVMEVNFKGMVNCARAVGKQMLKQKSGAIVNTASVAGIRASADGSAYSCSKAAIIMLTKALATEWGSKGIRVNAICPGVMATDMTKDMTSDKSFNEMLKARVPLRRAGQADELSGVAVFLASEASSYMTGHALVVDGGWTVGL
jgi:NAD(P)-dependent dehydrogenase (short-subunit alcohol dehydrogenase family)